jgi:predicted TIM-barrel fold metal-dependent hydrolase
VTEAHKPDDAHLLGLIARWIPDERQRHRIWAGNPQTLYGF